VAVEPVTGAPAARQQPLGQFQRGLVGQQRRLRLFPADAPFAGPDVPAVQFGQAVQGQLPQPRVKGEWPGPQVIGQLPDRVGPRLLNHVRGINPRGEPPIDPQGDQLPQALLVAHQELLAGFTVALCRLAGATGRNPGYVRLGM
jgi:hypothetical protein